MKKTHLLVIFCLFQFAGYGQTQLLTNPNFDANPWYTNWNSVNINGLLWGGRGYCNPYSGNNYIWAGDIDDAVGRNLVNEDIYQTITIPPTTVSCTLFFWSSINTEDDPSFAYDFFRINLKTTSGAQLWQLGYLSNQDGDNGIGIGVCQQWTQYYCVVPSLYFGQTVRLSFEFTTSPVFPTLFRLDDVELLAYTSGGGTSPTANFQANTTTINVGQAVNFSDLSTNNPTSWSWSFPGGTPSSSTAQNPSVVYNSPGVYSVTLTAINANGSNTFTRTNYITVNNPSPVASFSSSTQTVVAGQQVTFFDQSSNSPTSWSWSFPGGTPTTSSVQNPTVLYNTPGVYNVSLTVANATGSNSTTRQNYITVTVPPPVANFTSNTQTIYVGQSVNFSDLSANSPTTWSWSFTGGTPSSSSLQNPIVTYNTQGVFAVSLTASNASGQNSITRQSYITVNPIPRLDLYCNSFGSSTTGPGFADYYNNAPGFPFYSSGDPVPNCPNQVIGQQFMSNAQVFPYIGSNTIDGTDYMGIFCDQECPGTISNATVVLPGSFDPNYPNKINCAQYQSVYLDFDVRLDMAGQASPYGRFSILAVQGGLGNIVPIVTYTSTNNNVAHISRDISQYKSNGLQIAFKHISNGLGHFVFDNVCVWTPSGTTAIQDIDPNQIKIYPNPFNEYIIVEGVNEGFLTISDLLGNILIENVILSEPNQRVSLSNLPAGFYFATVKDRDDKNLAIKKIVHN